jgi:hypothetical protein
MNTQSPEYKRVRENIVRKLCEFNSRTAWSDESWEDYKRYSARFYNLKLQFADSILTLVEIAADDQSTPKEIISCGFHCEDLLKNFRRVV